MIECLDSAALFQFLSLIPDIVEIPGANADRIIVQSEVGAVVWERQEDIYCRTPQSDPHLEAFELPKGGEAV